jgi:two-component sensor histidine kinase
MKLNEGLVVKTKLDEETVIYLEKVIEGFCLCLPIYKEITFLVPDKKSEGFVVIKSILLNDLGKIEINEGDSISDEQNCEARGVLENSRGIYSETTEAQGGILYLPISKNRKTPLGVVKIECKNQVFTKEMFARYFNEPDQMDEIYNQCYSKFMIDPYIFLAHGGTLEYLNNAASVFKRRIGASGEDWLIKLWDTGEGKPSLQDIIDSRSCTGIDFEVGKFEFFIIAYPLHIGDHYFGMFISIAEISMIKTMLKEVVNKSTIIKEVHHRVKNNLQTIASLLRLQTRRTNSFLIGKAFMESINRISSIALVYEALSQEGENVVNMKECIKNILSMIISNMVEPNKSIKGEIRGQDIYLSGSQASNVSLCITELLQNALEHAFVFRKNGNILVTLKQVNREIIITVEDDGVGLSGKKSKAGSLGLEIIQMITSESLKGSFKLESHTYGSVGEIRFPIN